MMFDRGRQQLGWLITFFFFLLAYYRHDANARIDTPS